MDSRPEGKRRLRERNPAELPGHLAGAFFLMLSQLNLLYTREPLKCHGITLGSDMHLLYPFPGTAWLLITETETWVALPSGL